MQKPRGRELDGMTWDEYRGFVRPTTEISDLRMPPKQRHSCWVAEMNPRECKHWCWSSYLQGVFSDPQHGKRKTGGYTVRLTDLRGGRIQGRRESGLRPWSPCEYWLTIRPDLGSMPR